MDVGQKDREPAMTIRQARAEDYEEIAALCSAAGLETWTKGRDSTEPFCRQLEHLADLYLVATDGDRMIGVVLGSHDHRKGWINRLAVLPQYRHRGVAKKLVLECERAIRARGIGIVAALIDPANTASCALFETLGYRTDVPARYYRKLAHPEA